jgi:DNA-binding transcriptional LysR family regulator
MDKLTSMKVFAAIARLGSFSAAAEELGISRAMASKYLNYLEDDLDVRLLNRTTRQLSLTEVGSHYLERINNILAEIEETELAITELQSEPRGILKIMSPPSFGSFHLARALGIYKERYPGVTIEMILTDRVPDLFEEGVDLAIWIGKLEDSSLIARKLATTRSVVCGAPEYLKRRGIPQTPADLEQHNCLTFSTRTPFSDWKIMRDGKLVTLHPTGSFRANSADPLRIAAINGCGLVQLPSYIVGLDIQARRLQPVLEEFEPEPLTINAVYIHRRHLSAKARTFVDFMCEQFQPNPYWEKWIRKD